VAGGQPAHARQHRAAHPGCGDAVLIGDAAQMPVEDAHGEFADAELAEAGEELAVQAVAVGLHGDGETPSRPAYQASASADTRLSPVIGGRVAIGDEGVDVRPQLGVGLAAPGNGSGQSRALPSGGGSSDDQVRRLASGAGALRQA
jgi:hypothetical protein